MTEPICDEVVELNGRIFAERLRLGEVLNRAGVNRSTWARWVNGETLPRLETLHRIRAAIDAKIQERA